MDVGYSALSGPWGENTSITAQVKGCTGVVIDGLTRDHRQLCEMRYPVFARGVTPAFGRARIHTIAAQVPILHTASLCPTLTRTELRAASPPGTARSVGSEWRDIVAPRVTLNGAACPAAQGHRLP